MWHPSRKKEAEIPNRSALWLLVPIKYDDFQAFFSRFQSVSQPKNPGSDDGNIRLISRH